MFIPHAMCVGALTFCEGRNQRGDIPKRVVHLSTASGEHVADKSAIRSNEIEINKRPQSIHTTRESVRSDDRRPVRKNRWIERSRNARRCSQIFVRLQTSGDALKRVIVTRRPNHAYCARWLRLSVKSVWHAQHTSAVHRALSITSQIKFFCRLGQRRCVWLPFVGRECAAHSPVDV